MAAPNEDWIPLFPTIELAPGRARYIAVGGSELAVFHLAEPDRFVVINNSCPHAGGNLSAGTIAGAEVTCPWHDWTFNLDTAECTMN